jgi:eukaryotic translation initiation factor 2C
VIKKVSQAGASDLTFTMREGGSMTVADYFRNVLNRPLRFPDVVCVEVGSGALIPLELCNIIPGQIMRKQIPPEKTKDVVEFATMHPTNRLQSIRNGLGVSRVTVKLICYAHIDLQVLAYGQSEYVRQFGLHVEDAAGPLAVQARVVSTSNIALLGV